MNKNRVLKIINDNANTDNESFMYFLHEQGVFDEKSYWKFYNSIRYLGIENYSNELPRELTAKIIKSYEWFLFLMVCHFNKKDRFKIKNLPSNYFDYFDRLRTVLKSYLLDKPITDDVEDNMNKYLQNI